MKELKLFLLSLMAMGLMVTSPQGSWARHGGDDGGSSGSGGR